MSGYNLAWALADNYKYYPGDSEALTYCKGFVAAMWIEAYSQSDMDACLARWGG
jgi:hypothetical protein